MTSEDCTTDFLLVQPELMTSSYSYSYLIHQSHPYSDSCKILTLYSASIFQCGILARQMSPLEFLNNYVLSDSFLPNTA